MLSLVRGLGSTTLRSFPVTLDVAFCASFYLFLAFQMALNGDWWASEAVRSGDLCAEGLVEQVLRVVLHLLCLLSVRLLLLQFHSCR